MPDYASLPDSEINRLCAERCGWRNKDVTTGETPDGVSLSRLAWVKPGTPGCRLDAPDYCRDRNALVELIMKAAERDGAVTFNFAEYLMAAEKRPGWLSVSRHLVTLFVLQADPKNIAVAFLRATEGQG